jgi:class 3 adenylate cyclase/tetratricopeptide (TPR) repeat protein
MECGYDFAKLRPDSKIDYSQPQDYTPKFLADKILKTRSSIEGERKLVTVMFADVANFTSISEKLDPEDAHQIMDGCFKILMDAIHQNAGTINQFTGDGVMALFGAPLAMEDHAGQACRAALSIQKAIKDYGRKIQAAYDTDFKLRIGLNSGQVVVGAIGDDLRMDYTAVGDITNLADRMQSMAAAGTVLATENTYKLSRDFFDFERMGEMEVKGKQEPQAAYRLIKPGQIETRVEASMTKGWTNFVGREKEMHVLEAAFEKTCAGAGRVASPTIPATRPAPAFEKTCAGAGRVAGIVGEAGMGKSRLLLEFSKSLLDRNAIFLEGRCFQHGGSVAYLPFLDILKTFFDFQEDDSEVEKNENLKIIILERDESLHEILPPIQDVLSLKVNDEAYLKLEPQQKRERIFDALIKLFLHLSSNNTLVLAVEDLHWIDKTSEALLDHLIARLANSNIFLILLYRPVYAPAWVNKSYYVQVGMDQLSSRMRSDLTDAILRDAEVAPEIKELILNKAGGNPLYIEEFVHHLIENGSIHIKGGQYILNVDASEIQIPDTIEGIIAARMDRLEDIQKPTLQTAAVIGRTFSYRVLQNVMNVQTELKTVLLKLQSLEFVYEQSVFPEREFIFKHVLTQEVAYKSLLVKKRKDLHAQIGQAIEQLYPDRLEAFYEVLAHHYSLSENGAKASLYLKLSGQKAMHNYSAWEAMSFYNQAIAILDRMPADLEQKNKKLEVLYLSISPLIALGFPQNSLEILEQGERLAKELDDLHKLFRFHTNIGFFYCTTGKYNDARTYIEQAFDAAEKFQNVDLMGAVAPDFFVVHWPLAEHAKLVDVMRHIVDILVKSQKREAFFGGPCNVYAVLLSFWGYSLAWTGNFEKALSHCEKGLKAAAEIDDITTLGMCEGTMGHVLGHKGDLKAAKEYLELGIMHNEKAQYTPSLPYSHSWFGLACALAGDPDTGRKHAEKGLKISSDAGYNWMNSHQYFCLGICCAQSGDYDAARHIFEKGLEISRNNYEKFTEGSLLIWLGRVLGKSQLSENTDAYNSILQGIRVSEELSHRPDRAIGNFFLGEFHADRKQKERATSYLKRALKLFEEMGMQYWPDEAQKVLDTIPN